MSIWTQEQLDLMNPDSALRKSLVQPQTQTFDPAAFSDIQKRLSGLVGQNKSLPMYDFLSKYLMQGTQGIPFKDELLQTSTGAIKSQYDRAGQNLQDTLSAKGLGKSGISVGAGIDLQGQESAALNNATANINQQDIAYRNQAISQLLGLSQAEGQYGLAQNQQGANILSTLLGTQLQGRGLDLSQQQLQQQWAEFMKQLGFQQDQASQQFLSGILGDAGTLAGLLIGGPAGAAAGGYLGSNLGGGGGSTSWQPDTSFANFMKPGR